MCWRKKNIWTIYFPCFLLVHERYHNAQTGWGWLSSVFFGTIPAPEGGGGVVAAPRVTCVYGDSCGRSLSRVTGELVDAPALLYCLNSGLCPGSGPREEAAVGERAEPGRGVHQAGAERVHRRLHQSRYHHHRAGGLHRGRPQGLKIMKFYPQYLNEISSFTHTSRFTWYLSCSRSKRSGSKRCLSAS